ncbi:MAG: cytochrome c oxidase subunit 3 [Rhodospirillales bacterium]|nr:cytochrome c oxidase subunit 3 [Rhodospirillales bacterium]MCW8951533.1 cytochrome c oxidase subunit 3 [Rhodospirillales bacterium]MCW8969808.1 cytochrome c oxidase subunit 3 [Rhodospirillales bacterium]MCW9002869.1 cytochrome c oxidase subunit 3 [Rhodospirillales bacterium]
MNDAKPLIVEEEAGWGALDHLPGNPMIWVLIIGELLVFAALFIGFGVLRLIDVEEFTASQDLLNRMLGGINTLVLLTSGFLAAMAVRSRGLERIRASRFWMIGSMLVGSLFLIFKLIEYADKANQGVGITTNDFFTLFYLSTGFHFLHVILGLIILAIVTWKNSLENMETGAAFWHMVDLIWVILYPVAYLIR